MINMKFKADDYISLEVGLEHASGDPFVLGTLVGVLITGSGSATVPTPEGMGNGVGNKPGWASVALAGGAELNIPTALQPAVIGETLYITTAGAITRTATGNQRFGKVTHLGDTDETAIVKIVQ